MNVDRKSMKINENQRESMNINRKSTKITEHRPRINDQRQSMRIYENQGKSNVKMENRLVDLARNCQNSKLTVSQQEQIMEILDALDECKILHNDGNILNLMVNHEGQVQIIDFGLSSKIDKKREKKHGKHPNTKTTLYMMNISFKRYKISAPLLVKRVEQYLSSLKN